MMASIFERILAVICVVTGIALGSLGAQLLLLGGSAYYVCAGALFVLSGVQLWRARSSGGGLYLLLVGMTLIWSLAEAGLDGWALLPRLDLVLVGGVLIAIALMRRHGWRWRRRMPGRAVVLIAICGVGLAAGLWNSSRILALAAGPASRTAVTVDDGEWPAIGRLNGAERFSPLGQIGPENVSRLQVAWTVRLGMPPLGKGGTMEATPLKLGDSLYTCDMNNVVVALDAETGRTRWRFDPKLDRDGVISATCRGVTHYRVPDATGPCSDRIVSVTADARMFALDSRTGGLCTGFGKSGFVDLTQGMGPIAKGYYYLTSPALALRDKLVVGGSVVDGQATNEPSGAIRAFDAVTGRFAWAWDMGRPGQAGLPGPGERFTPGTPNAWAPLSGDDRLGLVYAPLGNGTPDYVAAHRSAATNAFSSSVVAIDIETGALRWSFQTVHRDVWDYDVGSPPTLTDFPTPQGIRPALIQATKRGEFFVLDRQTGKPLVRTIERPAPQGAVPGERLSPTQPFPMGMPSFAGAPLTEARMWGISPFDQLWCRIKFRQARYDGIFTPVGLKPTIVYPGNLGGAEWSGVAVDPERRIMVLNVNHVAMYDRMVRRPDADPRVFRQYEAGKVAFTTAQFPQTGTPYGIRTRPFLSPLGVPCSQPPFSEIAAVDLASRKTLWRKPLGTARDSGPFGLRMTLPIPLGVPALGGALVTRSGLAFIAATQERNLRAFDVRTGRIVWQDRLPASGNANPMTYMSGASERQFIVISASGSPQVGTGGGDYLVAYALPRPR